MAEALARGFMDRKVIEPSDIWCCDPSKARMEVFANLGANGVEDAVEVPFPVAVCTAVQCPVSSCHSDA